MTQKKILEILKKNGWWMSTKEISLKCDLTKKNVLRYILRLRKNKQIIMKVPRKNRKENLPYFVYRVAKEEEIKVREDFSLLVPVAKSNVSIISIAVIQK